MDQFVVAGIASIVKMVFCPRPHVLEGLMLQRTSLNILSAEFSSLSAEELLESGKHAHPEPVSSARPFSLVSWSPELVDQMPGNQFAFVSVSFFIHPLEGEMHSWYTHLQTLRDCHRHLWPVDKPKQRHRVFQDLCISYSHLP